MQRAIKQAGLEPIRGGRTARLEDLARCRSHARWVAGVALAMTRSADDLASALTLLESAVEGCEKSIVQAGAA